MSLVSCQLASVEPPERASQYTSLILSNPARLLGDSAFTIITIIKSVSLKMLNVDQVIVNGDV